MAASPALAAVFPAAITRSGPLRWRWPIEPPPQVMHRFQIGPEPWSPGHRGADLAASAGTRIRAPADGVVTFTGMVAGRPVISIEHGPGLISSMEPVLATVRAGQRINAGDVVGILSPIPGHCRPAACLHWGVRAADRYIDPLALVGAAIGPIILLPDVPDYAQPWQR